MRGVSVRFGGNRAVDDVSISVQPDELVGLIGTNGAGKSTLLNAICGFVPSTGAIDVLGRDVSGLPAHRRHRAGLGRGFQSARLYPNLTVRESLMVALEAREHSWLVPSMTGLPPSRAAERRKRSEAEELVSFLGLGRYADEFVSNLSTGTRRIVELASLLAVDAKVLLLDEPTGGLAQRETEAFAPLIVRVRRELGAAMIVIEHDMPLIMSISDRVYCLEAGRVIAEGTPLEVRNNPLVIASYLGTAPPVTTVTEDSTLAPVHTQAKSPRTRATIEVRPAPSGPWSSRSSQRDCIGSRSARAAPHLPTRKPRGRHDHPKGRHTLRVLTVVAPA